MTLEIRLMTVDDYEDVYALWSTSDGMNLGEEDSRAGIALYLERNPGCCFVGTEGGRLVGTALCGHDGRRGILRHLAVHQDARGRGLGKQLVRACLEALAAAGISKCNVSVMDSNAAGLCFWQHLGARVLEYDWRTLQLATGGRAGSTTGSQFTEKPMSNLMATLRAALHQLEQERATIDRQIATLRSVLGHTKAAPAAQPARTTMVRRRKMSAAARKLISQRMKALWGKRKAAAQTKGKH